MTRSGNGERAVRPQDKRRSQRIRMYSPIHAEIDGVRATLVDLSAEGARIEAPLALPVGGPSWITLTYERESLQIDCVVTRCRLDRSLSRDAIVYDTGLEFVLTPQVESGMLQMLNAVATEDLGARREYAKKRLK